MTRRGFFFTLFCLFAVLPECGHILEGLALGLGNELPDEEGCDDTDDAIETVGEPVAEVITFRQVHVEHGHERRAYDEVGNPLASVPVRSP